MNHLIRPALLLLVLLNGCVAVCIKYPGVELNRRTGLDWHMAQYEMPLGAVMLSTEIHKGKGDPFRFQGVYENNGDAISWVGMTPLGTRAFSLTFDEANRDYDHLPFYRMPMKADKLLFYWLAASLPLERVSEHVWGVTVTEDPAGVRSVQQAGKLLATIKRSGPATKPRFEVLFPQRRSKRMLVVFQVHQQDFETP